MSETLMKYHPRAGYTYMPGAKLRMAGQRGGYLVRANASGFRSEREFAPERKPDTFRALLFGDSQTAADGVSNPGRYSDLLEKAVPGLEIYNYAVSGQSPDQQLLLLEEQAHVERDLVVFGLYVENIRRITSQVLKSRSPNGEILFRAKPYFEIENDTLVLRNVPVAKEAWTETTLPDDLRPYVYGHGEADRVIDHLKAAIRKVGPMAGPLARVAKSTAMRFGRMRPVPEYDTPDHPAWRLMRRILERFVELSKAPVLVVLIPHYFFLSQGSDPSDYQARFREFAAATGCHVYDPLPDLLQGSAEERSALWSDADGHLSASGHQTLARLLAPQLQQLMRARG